MTADSAIRCGLPQEAGFNFPPSLPAFRATRRLIPTFSVPVKQAMESYLHDLALQTLIPGPLDREAAKSTAGTGTTTAGGI